MLPTAENCTQSALLAKSPSLQLTHFVQFVLSVSSIIVVAVGLCDRRPSPALVRPSLRIVAGAAVFFYSLHSFGLSVLRLIEFVGSFRTVGDCDFLWTDIGCFLARLPLSVAIGGYNLIFVVLALERGIATVAPDIHLRYGILIGCSLVFLTGLAVIGLIGYVTSLETFGGRRTYCMFSTPKSYDRMIRATATFIFLNSTAAFIGLVLFFVNKRQFERRAVDYSLDKSFQLNENILCIRMVAPLALLHFVVFLFYALAFVWSKDGAAGWEIESHISVLQWIHSMNCAYILVMLIVGFRVRRSVLNRQPRRQMCRLETNAATEQHFAMFDALIDSAAARKPNEKT